MARIWGPTEQVLNWRQFYFKFYMGELDMDIRSQPPHVSTEEYRVTEHVMETMKQEMPTIVRSMVNFIIYSNANYTRTSLI